MRFPPLNTFNSTSKCFLSQEKRLQVEPFVGPEADTVKASSRRQTLRPKKNDYHLCIEHELRLAYSQRQVR